MTPATIETPQLVDAERLATCEAAISQSESSCFEQGKALRTIRGSRLYRHAYPTFESYVAERWELTRGRAYQLIDAYELLQRLESKMSTRVDTFPKNERQARLLLKLETKQQPKAWQAVIDRTAGHRITAALVSTVVAEMLGTESTTIDGGDTLIKLVTSIRNLIDKGATIPPTLTTFLRETADYADSVRSKGKSTAEVNRPTPFMECMDVISNAVLSGELPGMTDENRDKARNDLASRSKQIGATQ